MTSNEKYQRYVIPKLQEFWNEHREDYINSGLQDGLMLPSVFDKYDNSKKKIFYIGQDAPYWLSEQCMTTLFDQDKYLQYVRLNNEVMSSLENRLAWGNSSSAFWSMVIKLHMYLMTNNWYDDIYSISTQDIELLETIGYGNTNTIPLLRTITKYQRGTIVQNEYYYKVTESTYNFNDLYAIIDNFEPDIIIILGCSFDEERYFGMVGFRWHGNTENETWVGDIRYKNKTSRIIWTYNPNYYKYMGENMHSIADKIKKYA